MESGAVIGIFVHSEKMNIEKRPIKSEIKKVIGKKSCVSCGSTSAIVCDHKNDIYNDTCVLDTKTQKLDDFQPLCNHCNLQKRQVFKDEKNKNKLYSAKNIPQYSNEVYPFEFPWEKKVFDIKDSSTKRDTYWYDPIEFNKKIYQYVKYRIPILNEIHKNVHLGKLPVL